MFDPTLEESFFQIEVGKNKNDVVACTSQLTDEQKTDFIRKIEDNYFYDLYLDNLPAAVSLRDYQSKEEELIDELNFKVPIGEKVGEQYLLYNHWIFTVETQPIENSKDFYIVGFSVEPRSFKEKLIRSAPYHAVHDELYLDEDLD